MSEPTAEESDIQKLADELEALIQKCQASPVNNRVMSIIKTKLEEAGLWFVKLARETD